jgi:hypothetical protein
MNDAGTGEPKSVLDIALAFLREIVAAESICYHARNSDLDPLCRWVTKPSAGSRSGGSKCECVL